MLGEIRWKKPSRVLLYNCIFQLFQLLLVPSHVFWRLASLVSIGVGLEGVRIDDSFVIHQAIPFVLGLSEQGVVCWVANNLVGVYHLDFPWFGKGVLDFMLDILAHDVIIQLRVTFAVESEASDLAFDLLVIRSIAIILGSSADEFFDVFLVL